MGAELPALSLDGFRQELAGADAGLESEVFESLFAHYQELRLWARRQSLIGPGTAGDAVVRHYVESLAAVPFLDSFGSLVDVGSGAGFPGLVLAAAVPGLAVWLVESRQRKAAFLEAAARRMGIRVTVVAGRVGVDLPAALPAKIDFLTLRAVRLDGKTWRRLVAGMTPGSRVLLWTTDRPAELPDSLQEMAERALGGHSRRLLVLQQKPAGAVG